MTELIDLFQAWIYRTRAGTFISLPDLTFNIAQAACGTVMTKDRGSEVVVFGGTGTAARDQTWIYNIASDQWSQGNVCLEVAPL